MIDFIEYVVTELKTKRLSKTNAVSLVQQFSRGASRAGGAAVLHPLLHRNTSDLTEQRYSSTFTGQEFFLTDHQVAPDGQAAQKVLPGVAYLEMVRAAMEQALPAQLEPSILELRNTVWAQPVVVSGKKEVSIALLASDDDQVDFEIYSQDGGDEIVHCQGHAVSSHEPAPAAIDLEQLRAEMAAGTLGPDAIYATCARMGLLYGPALQAIIAIHRGSNQLLAELRLPASVADGSEDYVLHPSLMDGALQAAVGLMDRGPESMNGGPESMNGGPESTDARLPFALETLRILAPCTPEMVAWLRYAPGSQASGKVVKLDIDLCDARGTICVQMRGFSWRILSSQVRLTASEQRPTGTLLATPVWQASDLGAGELQYAEHHVLSLQKEQPPIGAQQYSEHALDCFQRIQDILQRKPPGRVLVQIVVSDELLAGLSGLLKTAALENPQFTGQLIIVPAETAADELLRYLEDERRRGLDAVVRYAAGGRQVLRWQEVEAAPEGLPIALKDGGVYLITGGMGGLGLLFAREILDRTREARVLLTGRFALTAEKQRLLDGLSSRASYRQLDVVNPDEVTQLVAAIRGEYGQLDGILHSAGMTADNFILKKTAPEFSEVLAPKVTGTFNLDQATRDVDLDFFVLFSAIAGVMGNLGQADYAAANGFLDHFAAYRNRQVAAKQRHGRTRSIDWPLWQAGGMGIDAASQERLQQTTGMHPMQTATGIAAFHRSLALPYDQLLVVEGDLDQVRRALLAVPEALAEAAAEPAVAATVVDADSLAEKTQHYLRKQFSETLKVPAQKIDARAPLENYGIDSIIAMKLTNQLEATFGSLPKTLFFEYQTIRELADYFVAHYPGQLAALFTPAVNRPIEAAAPVVPSPAASPAKVVSSRRSGRRSERRPAGGRSVAPGAAAILDDPIAIVGLSGRYPESVDLDAYWENLRDGKDCITEVPKERWNWREYFSDDRTKSGRHYSKWGGFISGVDEFDPLFFNISPVEAEQIDPQERLFLQHAWMAIEDAGYTRAGLQVPSEHDLPGQVGVYVGVMYTEYQLFGAEAAARGKQLAVPGSAASIANRVSYALNLHGPSMTLDTMCSSSLTAIHLACEDLKRRRTNMAIAGGVNVTIHPNKYQVLSNGQFISSDGHCQSFGEGGDGYIPGEGVGAVVLKRLSDARRDGDHIYGIIRGSALNHGGKTNGYSVPNPQAQAAAISRALSECHIDARHISYIEAHGTGTKLGDPIEIAALTRAFHQYSQDAGFCLIGSAKSNIGHCESAAGIAGLTKVLLQMQHQQIVPSLHSQELNPHIDFDQSPFVVNQVLRPWEQPTIDGRQLPRLAGISSFGAGGSNAHMIVEEYQAPVQQPAAFATVIIVLSARTASQLQQKAAELLEFLRPRLSAIDLVSLAFTLQVGREPMEERLGFVVNSVEELAGKLQAYLAGEQDIEDAYQGRVKRNDDTLTLFNTDVHLQHAIEQWIVHRKLSKLLDLWVNGLEVAWSRLYAEATPQRMSLPTYPFAREHYWIDVSAIAEPSIRGAGSTVLHPLLQSNTSDMTEQRYSSTFTGDEFFLADHQVNMGGRAGGKVLPGVAYLEMARAAIEEALPLRPPSSVLELHNTVWAQPVVVTEPKEVHIALLAGDGEQIDFEVYSRDGGQETIHCQGRATFSQQPAPARLDLGRLKAEMGDGMLTPDSIYAACARIGLVYGHSFRGITAVHRGSGQLLADLRLPAGVERTADRYVLHPSLMDGALQACVALMGDGEGSEPRLPFALETLRILAPCTTEMVAWARYAPGSAAADSVVKLDIDLCDAGGNVCVQLHGFSARALSTELRPGRVLATPVWQAVAVAAGNLEFAEAHLLALQPEPNRTIAQQYVEQAIACFDRIQTLFQGRPRGKVLLQVVVRDEQEQALLAGLSGLLKTAALENPQFTGQLILVPAELPAEELDRYVDNERRGGVDPLVRYVQGVRHVLRWEEIPAGAEKAPIAFKDDGLYLITGGLGGLGVLFAREILAQTPGANVVLTGRSAFSAETQARLDELSPRVSYRQVDLENLDEVERLIGAIRDEHGRLDGILHSAGMIADRFILNKESGEFRDVLAPKVAGTYNLDRASRDVELDFFVLFSSLAGPLGNPGQADYAAANGFLDQFAAYRNRQVAAKQRHGRTRSIDWPLWHAGGMGMDPERLELLQQATGMAPMQTAAGMETFHRTLALPYDQTLVVEGDPARIRRALFATPAGSAEQQAVVAAMVDAGSLADKTQDYLRRELSAVLKVPSQRIDPLAALEEYGIDSVLAMKLTSQLEKTFGSLSKTLFFEYQTIHELAGYFVANHSPQLTAMLAPAATASPAAPQAPPPAPARRESSRRFARQANAAPAGTQALAKSLLDEPIAIVGLSGRYPEAIDVDAYWQNLREGKDCITEVPKQRWDWLEYFSEDRGQAGRHYSKWGGFIEGVDEFDPLFFNISPVDAEMIDPQERLFLQHAWMAVEDAGYTRSSLQVRSDHDLPGQVGVYAGVMYNEYQLFGAEASARGKRLALPGSTASIANRVSYVLNLHGPSVTLDTMCSSSLTAIHFACLDLKLGRTSLAIAGGVNVTIHPNKYLVLSAGQFISGDGHCQSFGEGGDGYIPGEGVGVVVLKRLSDAKRDGDHIYAIIRGSALNHGGKTNGYTVPNPQAQATAISRALAESHTDARHVSYIEAHGTGTKLGDPIEIAALSKAFHQYTDDTGFCRIGSAKSNIGHCESAAGIAGLTKVLLQMQHQEIVPSLHSAQLNPHIDFDRSPFVVNQTLRPWEQPVVGGQRLPRIAGISSFGAGGSNAHLVVEEYPAPVSQPLALAKAAIVLSARTPEQLQQKARDLAAYLRPRLQDVDLAAVAYTLQAGREAMEERLAFVVASAEELAGKLEAYVAGEQGIEDAYQGQVKRSNDALSVFSADADLQQTVDKWIAHNKLSKLADLWVKGLELDWSKLYGETRPLRVSLPAYPFARDRYWIDVAAGAPAASVHGAAIAVLHPLLHSNVSDLSEQRYRTTFTGDEFFLDDHQVKADGGASRKVLPGVAQLEMARAAIEAALPDRPESMILELRNVVWAQPVVVAEPAEVSIALFAEDHEQIDEQIDYEIFSGEGERQLVHGQGRAVLSRQPAPARLDLEELRTRMDRGSLDAASVYPALARMGLLYGPAFQGIRVLHRGTGQLLAELRLPGSVEHTAADYVLHPALLDSALQSSIGLLDDPSAASNEPRLPFALETLRIIAPCTREMVAWVRYAPGSQAGDAVVKVDVDLCDERGNICVQLRGFSSRVPGREVRSVPAAAPEQQPIGMVLAHPVWQSSAADAPGTVDLGERHVILCELLNVDVEQLGSWLPLSQVLALDAEEGAEEGQDIARRYSDYAVECFERLQAILQSKPEGKVLVQIVVADAQEAALFAGLSALVTTAALENPQIIGQVILVPAGATTSEVGAYLEGEKSRRLDRLIRHQQGRREVLRWQEAAVDAAAPSVAFQERGVYLITGGMGGLGLLFAREIVDRTREARVILTGRAPLTAEKQALLDGLSAQRVTYRTVDLDDLAQVRQLIAAIEDEHGQLNGILHSAGMTADRFIVTKNSPEFRNVLAPKVTGTFHLDQASRDVELDFFVLFSSIAGAVGNAGQSDYATANGFLDQYAAYRNRLVTAKQRRGLTRSIDWPLWQSGGMTIDAAGQEQLRQTTGMHALRTASGMEAFYRSLSLPYDQLVVVEGDVARIRRLFVAAADAPSTPQPIRPAAAVVSIAPATLAEKTQDYLRKEFSALLKLPVQKIDAQAPLENYGIDSILAMRLTNHLEQTFGSLSKTLFFEHQTIASLAGYFVRAHAATLQGKLGLGSPEAPAAVAAVAASAPVKQPSPARRSRKRFAGSRSSEQIEIAIVGLGGRYPQAENLDEFWRNLQNGRDSITEIPLERWNHELYYDADPNKAGKSYSKWGGFIDDVDKFDSLFFNISPKEAALIDPQERLFLETVWQTVEDAGYTKESIAGHPIGVFVGVMWGQYELFGAESLLRGNASLPGSSHASIANRVSYFFDFHGPSIALDTMCSSSLTAIHLACDALRKGEIEAAIAGGVNVSIHPYKYVSLSQGKFASSDGRCRSFGAGGDGYVPGEGVGAVLLKPLDHALRDGDQIYAVIKSSSINHGGKTNGYTVPNPNAQGTLVADALRKANIDPGTLSYIETHGTGTSLGDPIEITGLLQAFGPTEEKQFCPIGSVKSNIGHLESAAGIAAVTKALLQMKHEQLVPSLHADPLNPNINFEDSPFYVQTELADWKRKGSQPRRAGVSSFGAGGSNAHLILEDYAAPQEQDSASHGTPEVFVLSARNPEALRRYAERMVRFLDVQFLDGRFLDGRAGVSLSNIAYTSQVGRTPMTARLAIVTSSATDLRGRLRDWLAGGFDADVDGLFYASGRDESPYSVDTLVAGAAGKAFVETLLAHRDLERIAWLWTLGADVDWSLLPRDGSPHRVSLPTYPFEKERHWIKQEPPALHVVHDVTPAARPAAIEKNEEKRRNYYFPQWTPKPLAHAESWPPAGPILILDSSEELFRNMREQLGNEPVVLVKPGTSFEELGPGIYSVDPEREEQFRALVADLKTKSLLPRTIVHHAAQASLEVRDEVARQLDAGLYALVHLCRILPSSPEGVRILSLHADHPLGAAMSGFLRTLTLEDPSFAGKTVAVDGDPLAVLRDELSEGDWIDAEVRHHRGTRSIRTLVSQVPERKLSVLPLRKHGVYLISGGMGGLGVIFSEYLAKNYQARLVLIGRSAVNAAQEAKLEQLRGYGAEVLTVRADVSNPEDVERVVREAQARFGELHGVIHAAGVTRDALIVRKTREEMEAVLAPKVYGTINLDLATSGENLDFFVSFSSIAGALGNAGQSDYAFGNHFLDSFVETRELLRRAQKRSGRTLSINWPFWEEGGMSISRDDLALMEKRTGLAPLPTSEGIRYWEDLLRSDAAQAVALYGVPSRIAASLAPALARTARPAALSVKSVDSSAVLFAKTETYLKTVIGEEIKLAPDRIGSSDPLESFGLDSVMINKINAELERDLGALPKTLLYENETVRQLATYLVREAREALVSRLGSGGPAGEPPVPPPAVRMEEDVVRYEVAPATEHDPLEAVAIIGIHGAYPHSASLDEYWDNLRQGKDLIDLVPPSRWDYEEFYHPDPAAAAEGKIYCKWGGFVDNHDRFDPHFFKISTAEAKIMDPQERMFLESVWAAFEDAGYTRDRLRARFPKAGSADVGVFVGVTTNTYQLWAPEERMRGNFVSPTAMPWSIANRVSYFFDFNGPSLPIDTACSSSLVAIHLACESLRNRECQIAVAGGVNLYLHPAKYQSLCEKRMVSLDGKCHSYGAGDDGFVPGEGVGTLILKPLSRAIEDQDRIYAVIRGSAYDHSGRSNGYSAPNPNAQARLISSALEKADIHPDTIGYVEGHGTGTQLGDSIEIAALTKAFQTQTARKQYCPIGSVKANIGHSESAAGIAGLAKVILQMQHGQLAPSIHSDEPNPNIEFLGSPFYLQHGLAEWPAAADHPRRALVNSFGAGGVNAVVVIEEYETPAAPSRQETGPWLFTLSARNEERLHEYAERLLARLRSEPDIDVESLCYTLQTGREAMEERLAIVVSDAKELIDRLEAWSRRDPAPDVQRGSLGPRRGSKRSLKLVKTGPGEQSLIELASKWVAGEDVEWESLYSRPKPRRIGVPTYPFARERYWVSDAPPSERSALTIAHLHPLIAYNSSTLKEVNFSSSLPDTAFYAIDHQVREERIFPGAGFLEMACIAANMAGEQRVRKLTDIVWIRPLSFRNGAQSLRTVLRDTGRVVEYEISSFDEDNEQVVHSEGRLDFGNGSHQEIDELMPPEALKALCASPQDGARYYEQFAALGLHYGPSFQTIQELYVNDHFALAKLKIADHLKGDFGQFILHPSIIDGALQTIGSLFGGAVPRTSYLPFALDEIEILKPVPQTCYAYAERADALAKNHAGVTKFHIRLLNEHGETLIKFKNLYVRPLIEPLTAGHTAAAPPSPANGSLRRLSGGALE